jgi:two-component system heavy metal sensor histidine kinase CusS
MSWMIRGEHWSLVRRLSIWYALAVFLLLSIATGLLYWGVVRRFDQENDQYLHEKINGLGRLLSEPSQRLPTVRWEVEEESIAPSSVRILSRVSAVDGHVLFETNGMERELPRNQNLSDHSKEGIDIRTPSGRRFRVLTSAVEANRNSGNGPYRVEVAIDLGYEQRLLQSYVDQLWLVLGVGLLASVAIGYRIAKTGIAPLQTMAETVKRVRSSTLGERLALAGLPSELSVLAETFNEVLGRLEEAFGRLSRFSSDLAHELRTPIGNIRGELEVALTRVRNPTEYRDVVQSSLEECEKLSRLIDRLLFLARSEHPETQIRREQLDIDRELETVIEFYEPAATEKQVSLQLQTESRLVANIDRTLFQVAVGNLVDNAVRHTPGGGSVAVAASVDAKSLIVQVRDAGVGIASEHLSHVFERFYRVDAARTHDGSGAGLGLAIVQTIARLHGGHASIDSALGQGTCVTIRLPYVDDTTKD